jgi:hypothetical protein
MMNAPRPLQRLSRTVLVILIALLLGTRNSQPAENIRFSGYDWIVRPSGFGGPGPNRWDADNVCVDPQGELHLKLTLRRGKWYGAEIFTKDRFGFGTYRFQVRSRLDRLDPNVVLGLFNYPTPDVGPDGTNEIDIEFARWGSDEKPAGNYSVAPGKTGRKGITKAFPLSRESNESTHQFTWNHSGVNFQSFQGRHVDRPPTAHWLFQPDDSASDVPQQPMPVHINLWCFRGQPPKNDQPVELTIRSFAFTPK